jgi:predicted nucleic acid-binding protein
MVYLWVDANVILRFLTGDPPDMAAKAMELMGRVEKGVVGLRVSSLVVAEVVWVLSSFYGHTKRQIYETLYSFLGADGIFVEDHDLLIQSLHDMGEKNVDFVDAYLAALANSQKESVCTFDNDFNKLNVKRVTPPGNL